MNRIKAGVLDIGYPDVGPADGPVIVLLHGFPYDVHAYDEVALILAATGKRCLVPYLRGYGPTRFLNAETPRSGEQAAHGVGPPVEQDIDAESFTGPYQRQIIEGRS